MKKLYQVYDWLKRSKSESIFEYRFCAFYNPCTVEGRKELKKRIWDYQDSIATFLDENNQVEASLKIREELCQKDPEMKKLYQVYDWHLEQHSKYNDTTGPLGIEQLKMTQKIIIH